MRPKGSVDAADTLPVELPSTPGDMRPKGGADAVDALPPQVDPPSFAGGMRPKGSGDAISEDYPELGTAAWRDVPESGDAAPDQVVLGNDSRLAGGGASPSTLAGLSDVNLNTPVQEQAVLSYHQVQNKWVNRNVVDGGNF